MWGLERAPREAVGVPGFGGRRLGLPASHLPDGWRRGFAGNQPAVRRARFLGRVSTWAPFPRLVSVAPQALRVSPPHGCSPVAGARPPATAGSSAAPASAPSGRPPAMGAALSFRQEKTPSPAPGCLPEAFPALQWFGGEGLPEGRAHTRAPSASGRRSHLQDLEVTCFRKSWTGPGARHAEPWMGAAPPAACDSRPCPCCDVAHRGRPRSRGAGQQDWGWELPRENRGHVV